MGQNFIDTKKLILSRKKILVTFPKFSNNDAFLAGCALFLTLKKIFDNEQRGDIDILISGNLESRRLVSDNLVKFFKKELESFNYVLTIPHENGAIEKVSYRDEEDALKFFITPSFGELCVDKIRIDQAGANYDLVVLVGFADISQLNGVYKKNKKLFDNVSKLVIGRSSNKRNCQSLVIDESFSISETVFSLIKELDSEISSEVSQMLLTGIISKSGGRLQNIKSRVTLNVISDLLDAGASMDLLNEGTAKGKTYAHLQLLQRVYANIRQDSAGILWSVVRNFELRELQISDNDIFVDESIQFNCYDGYKNVFVLYELSDGSVAGRIESDDRDAAEFISECQFVKTGDSGTFVVDKDLEVVENLILKKLGASGLGEYEDLSVDEEGLGGGIIGEPEQFEELLSIERKEDLTQRNGKKNDKPVKSPLAKVSDDENDDYLSTPIVDEGNGANFGPPQIFGTNNMGRQFGGY